MTPLSVIHGKSLCIVFVFDIHTKQEEKKKREKNPMADSKNDIHRNEEKSISHIQERVV